LTKVQEKNNLFAKAIGAKQATRKVEVLQQEYNDLNQFHWKNRNDLSSLQVEHDQFIRNYEKTSVSSVQ
jgi:hypothetical protein